MKTILCALTFVALLACASTGNRENSKNMKTGWVDPDTYMVIAEEINENKAVEQAKYQILKDIVNVRVRSNSRYTDISKIRDEFDVPLQQGKIIDKQTLPNGIRIYFQIRDTGLKQKFEKK